MALPIQPSRHEIYDFISYEHGMKDAVKAKKVLITGAGTGIGKHMAKHFALAGATSLILAGRRPAPLDEVKASIESATPGCKVLCVPTDIINESSVANLFERAGKVDILVNNAGAIGTVSRLADGELGEWWQGYETNVKGTYVVSHAYLRSLAGGPGVIINTSSRASYVVGPGMSSYQTSKTALNRLTESIDAEYSSQGIICIAFHPGGIADTDMGSNAPEWLKKLLIDSPELPAATAVYLSTERAAFLSGRFVDARWDMVELEKLKEQILSGDWLKTRVRGIEDQL